MDSGNGNGTHGGRLDFGGDGHGNGNGHAGNGKRVLITGGAGFIGSHLADELLKHGYAVRALDNLSPQVHGPAQRRPEYLDPEVELIVGDVRDAGAVRQALAGVDAVYHLAAAVGVGQSMYQIADYTSLNNLGTAVLLEALVERAKKRPVERLVVASSMSIYGEGLYRSPDGGISRGIERSAEQLRRHEWEVRNNRGQALTPVPTPESKQPTLASVYALSKYDQERMCLMVGRAYGIPTVALRFFNVFGTRQALSNPYTGVLAIFASRLLNDNPPFVFEDGLQQRDFVSVYDIAQACRLALEVPEAATGAGVFNVGSGRPRTVLEVAQKMAKAVGKGHVAPEVSGKYRVGDIRHCFADIRLARRVLGYEPKVEFEPGLAELAEWLAGQEAEDHVARARAELEAKGLAI
jgi:dTDP-L-rhamnose 4-epimerase